MVDETMQTRHARLFYRKVGSEERGIVNHFLLNNLASKKTRIMVHDSAHNQIRPDRKLTLGLLMAITCAFPPPMTLRQKSKIKVRSIADILGHFQVVCLPRPEFLFSDLLGAWNTQHVRARAFGGSPGQSAALSYPSSAKLLFKLNGLLAVESTGD